MNAGKRAWYAGVAFLACCALLLMLVTHEVSVGWIGAAAAWCRDAGPAGMAAYAAADALCVLAGLPAIVWTVLAGALWGVWPGLAVAFAGKWGGAMLVVLVVRGVGSARLLGLLGLEAAEELAAACGRAGWRLALALRVAPLVPYNLLNYGLALSDIPAVTLGWTGVAGMLPGTVALVYAGAVAGDIAAGVQEATDVRVDAWHVAGLAVALLVSGAVLTAATRLVLAELRRGPQFA